MNTKIKNILGISGILALLAFAFAIMATIQVFVKTVDPSAYRTFTVQGSGETIAIPDVARFSFSVITEGGTDVSTLQNENANEINGMIAFIKESGVEDEDIKTTSFNITPRYQYYPCNQRLGKPCPPSEIVGNTISQSVRVTVRDFEKTGILLGGISERGASTVSGLSFEMEDLDAAQTTARAEAISKAKEKARELAKAGGFRVGKLLSISEGGGYYPRFQGYAEDSIAFKEAVATPVIEPGSQEINITVTLTFEIK